jgi:4-hydroxyphenylpyruvate dioxygenase-like putative hemolysin
MSAEYADCSERMETLMAVKRIVPNIASDQLDKAKSFYAEILDMDVVM